MAEDVDRSQAINRKAILPAISKMAVVNRYLLMTWPRLAVVVSLHFAQFPDR
jgi:hypothetical protein